VSELLAIGEFSARCGLSVKVLRTYAAEGLLVPAAVDARSGYRYYAQRHDGGTTMTTLLAGSANDPGTVRDTNQDAVLISSPLFAVADGLGTSPAGETASRLALDTLKARFTRPPTAAGLAEAVRAASQAIWDKASSDPSLEGMASTLTAVAVLDDGEHAPLAVASVGDSRAYLFSGGQLHQLTHDQTVVQALMDAGELTRDDARTHPSRSLLTRALGIAPVVDPDIHLPALRGPARLLLCTDGLTVHAEDPQIADVLARVAEPDRAAARLIQLANHNGGSDNTAVIVVDVSPDQSAP
jgi:PPM family protein phosphatase